MLKIFFIYLFVVMQTLHLNKYSETLKHLEDNKTTTEIKRTVLMTNIPSISHRTQKYATCMQLIYLLLQLQSHSNSKNKKFNKTSYSSIFFHNIISCENRNISRTTSIFEILLPRFKLPLLAFKIMLHGVIFSAIYIFSPC